MKKLIIFSVLIAVIVGCSASETAEVKSFELKINFSFDNVLDGYDHLARILVEIDGAPADSSNKKFESEPNEITVQVPEGERKIKLTALAYYDGVWERHTKENGYNVDCVFESKLNMNDNKEMGVTFDLQKGASLDYLK